MREVPDKERIGYALKKTSQNASIISIKNASNNTYEKQQLAETTTQTNVLDPSNPISNARPLPDTNFIAPLTICVDCGGGGIKAAVLDSNGIPLCPPLRIPTPYPLDPERLAQTIVEISIRLPQSDRLTLGMPGMIRRGKVIYTPHYVNQSGPRTRTLPQLLEAWKNCDLQTLLTEKLQKPTLVLNDAEVHAAGLITGKGAELVLTFGTGIGCAFVLEGELMPHLEISHAPVRWGMNYDDYIGEHERIRLGDAFWSRRVYKVVQSLRPVFRWDKLYLGGGNARWISDRILARFDKDVHPVPNSVALVGGAKAWQMLQQ